MSNSKKYQVYTQEEFHLYEPEYNSLEGEYETYEEAVVVCKQIIDDFINCYGASPKELAIASMHWYECTYISPEPEGEHFSHSDYYNEAYKKHFKLES